MYRNAYIYLYNSSVSYEVMPVFCQHLCKTYLCPYFRSTLTMKRQLSIVQPQPTSRLWFNFLQDNHLNIILSGYDQSSYNGMYGSSGN